MARIDVSAFWLSPPPEASAGLQKWLRKIRGGWRPNRRLRGMGYYEAADWYGVFVWEYLNVLRPALGWK